MVESSVADSVLRVREAVEAATRRDGWWATARGETAWKYLEAWGAVERERRITGDPTAVPRSVTGGGARSRDSLSSILMAHATVERWLQGMRPVQRNLIRWVHRDGTEERVLAVLYRLPNGRVSEVCLVSDPVPEAYLGWERRVTVAEARVLTFEWESYPGWVPFREVLRRFGFGWGEFLEAVHVRCGQDLAGFLGC